MKRLPLLFLPLLFLACQQNPTSQFTGKFAADEPLQIQNLMLTGCDTVIYVELDSTQSFSLDFQGRDIPLFQLTGRIKEGKGSRWQFATPVYLAKGGVTDLTLNVKNNELTIVSKDKNNQALQECREMYAQFNQMMWNRTPKASELKNVLNENMSKAQNICKQHHTDKAVSDYVQTWNYLEYLNGVNTAKMMYSYSGRTLPEDIFEGFPPMYEVFDIPYWSLLENLSFRIADYLKENGKTEDEQLAFLQEHFKTPSIREDQNRQIVSRFIFSFPYSEENMKHLERLCAELPKAEKESILSTYYGKRFSVAGAEVPDLTFEDKDGNKHKLTEFKGKYIYLDLWASWCGPCNAEIPHLKKLEKELKNDNVVFVSISVDKDKAAWEKKMKEAGLSGHQWRDQDHKIGDMLNIPGIPYFIIYDKEGKMMEYKAPRPSNPTAKEMLKRLK